MYTSFPAFYMVEAAISIPVFVCFAGCILFFFCIMQLQLDVQASLNYTGRVLAEYAAVEEMSEEEVKEGAEFIAAEVIFRKHLKEQEAQTEYIRAGLMGIQLKDSEFEGEYICLKATYQITLPINFFGKHMFLVRQQAKTRKWIGDTGNQEEIGDWVYVTPSGTAYHKSLKCPYLDLSIRDVAGNKVATLRNASGGKYRACKECKSSGGSIVYITDYGEVYHGSLSCSGLKRTVIRMKKEKAGNRHACAKCGG